MASRLRGAVDNLQMRMFIRGIRGEHSHACSVVTIAEDTGHSFANINLILQQQPFPERTWEILRIENVRLIKKSGASFVTKLNDALRSSKGRFLTFVNAGTMIQPDFLIQHLLTHNAMPGVTLGDNSRLIFTHLLPTDEPHPIGVTLTALTSSQSMKGHQQLGELTFVGDNDYSSLFAYATQTSKPLPHPWALFSLTNVSLSREAALDIGGFDERFSGEWGLEAVDLAYRLHKSGVLFRYAPQAIALHQVLPPRTSEIRTLHDDIHHFLSKHSSLSRVERELILRGRYMPTA